MLDASVADPIVLKSGLHLPLHRWTGSQIYSHHLTTAGLMGVGNLSHKFTTEKFCSCPSLPQSILQNSLVYFADATQHSFNL